MPSKHGRDLRVGYRGRDGPVPGVRAWLHVEGEGCVVSSESLFERFEGDNEEASDVRCRQHDYSVSQHFTATSQHYHTTHQHYTVSQHYNTTSQHLLCVSTMLLQISTSILLASTMLPLVSKGGTRFRLQGLGAVD